MKKRILALITACAATLAVVPAFAGCSSETGVKYTLYGADGSEGETYVIAEDPSTEETAQEITAADGSYLVVTGYSGSPTNIVIPAEYSGIPVTEIAAEAFEGARKLKSIQIADSVTSIGTAAFLYCSRLSEVTLPSSLTKISQSTFAYCSSLASVAVPEGVTAIGNYGFYYCESLADISLPSTLTTLSYSSFYYCTSLSSIQLPDGLEAVGAGAFFYCTSLTSVTLPDSVTYVGYAAFQSCTALADITLSSSLTYIGSYAFCNCPALTTITIPSDVTYIGANALYYCTSLTAVYMDNEFSDGSTKACYLYSADLDDAEEDDGVEAGTYAVGSDAAATYLYTDFNYWSSDAVGRSAYIPSGVFEDSAYMLQLLTSDLVGMEDIDGDDVLVYWYFIVL